MTGEDGADRWQNLVEHFETLVEKDAAERNAFLDGLGDRELAAELRAMLDADDHPPSAIETRLLDPAEPRDPLLGRVLGGYHLIEPLGEGGMGRVYGARRVDSPFEHNVALKVLRAHFVSHDSLARFRLEQQVLAKLQHPHIATLIDGGVSESGLPYLVMQRLEGETITEHAARHDLGLEARIALVRDVCSAIDYAHARLIVHRDVKPSNIVVTTDGRVQLLDFGIAKLLDPADETPLTHTRGSMLTPDYAAPEQILGEAITTATDIFGLGLLLFELLSGRPARRLDTAAPAGLVDAALRPIGKVSDAARQGEGLAGLTPAAHARRLNGDLDRIVAKALHLEPERRYASARDLSQDLARQLAGLPVEARPDTLAYRGAKLLRRHPTASLLSVGLVLLLIAFAVTTSRQSKAFERQRDAARAERDRASEVTELLLDLFDVDPYGQAERADDLTLREFLQLSEERVETRLADRPDLRASTRLLLGRLYGNLGRLDRAETLLDASLEELKGLEPRPTKDIAEAMNMLATVMQYQGRFEEAEKLYRDTLALRIKLFGDDDLLVAESLNNLSSILSEHNYQSDLSDLSEVERLDRRALEIRRRLLGPRHLDVAQSVNNLGVLFYLRAKPGDFEETEALYLEALDIRTSQLGEHHPSVANTRHNLGALYERQGDLDRAEAMFEQAIEGWSASLGAEHAKVANGLYRLGDIERQKGQLEAAETSIRRALDIELAALPSEHPYLADGFLALGRVMLERGRARDAEPLLTEAVRRYQQLETGQIDEAEALLARCQLEL